MQCENCGHVSTGPGYDQDICQKCGEPQPFRSQPGGVNSDMQLRNMPGPTGDDMGGNPLQEGIWGSMDGGWQNRLKRDESFASVKKSSDDDWAMDDENPYEPTTGYPPEGYNSETSPYGPQERFIVNRNGQVFQPSQPGPDVFHEDIAREHGLDQPEGDPQFLNRDHALGVVNKEGTIKFNQNQLPFTTEQYQQLLSPYFPEHTVSPVKQISNDQRWALPGDVENYPRQNPKTPPTQQVKDQREWDSLKNRQRRNETQMNDQDWDAPMGGWLRDRQAMYLPWNQNTAGIEDDFDVVSVIPDGPHTEVADNGIVMQHDDPQVLEDAKEHLKSAGILGTIGGGLLGAAGLALAPETGGASLALEGGGEGLLGGAVGQMIGKGAVSGLVRSALDGGGGSNSPGAAAGVEAPGDPNVYSSIHAELRSAYDHPSVNQGYDDTDDPEKVDQHEVNDGDHDHWQKDIDVNGDGGTDGYDLDSPVGQGFQQAFPSLLKYHDSPESGKDDPEIQKFIALLEQHAPNWENDGDLSDEDHTDLQALKAHHHHAAGVPGVGGMVGVSPGMGQLAPAGVDNAVNPMSQASCPNCGARITPGAGICPQCGSAVNPMPGDHSPAAIPPPPNSPNTPAMQNLPVMGKVAGNQGPHNPEQFKAVKDYLIQTTPPEQLSEQLQALIDTPEQFGDILSEIQGKGQPPQPDPDPAPMLPPDPSQMQGQGPPPGGDPNAMGMPAPTARVAENNPIDLSHGQYTTPSGENHSYYQCPNCGGQMGENGECYRCGYQYGREGEGHHAEMPLAPSMNLGPIHQGAADSITPPCPKCGSHTTGMITNDGECRCTNCNHEWSVNVDHQGDDGNSPIQHGAAFEDVLGPQYPEEHALNSQSEQFPYPDHPSAETCPNCGKYGHPALGDCKYCGHPLLAGHPVTAALPDDHSDQSWATADGQPLQIGQTYEMYSGKYDVPDVIKVTAIRPESIDYTLTGTYGLEHRTELTRREAQLDGTTFTPTDEDVENDDPQEVAPNEQGPNDQMSVAASQNAINDDDDWDMGDDPDPTPIRQGAVRLAGRKYTPMQQREFIDEPGVARNSDKLDLSNTHYEGRTTQLTDDFFLFGL